MYGVGDYIDFSGSIGKITEIDNTVDSLYFSIYWYTGPNKGYDRGWYGLDQLQKWATVINEEQAKLLYDL